jgi:hypothetical protein
MTQISIGKENIREFGIYKEDDVLVLGFRLVPQAQYESLIFQIETKRDQRFEMWGMYSEINGKGSYGLVKNFSFDLQRSLLTINLEDKTTGNVQRLSFELWTFIKGCDRRMIKEMEHIFQTYYSQTSQW